MRVFRTDTGYRSENKSAYAVVCFPGSPRTERVMPVIIGRRELIAALGGAAVAWPFVARAAAANADGRVSWPKHMVIGK